MKSLKLNKVDMEIASVVKRSGMDALYIEYVKSLVYDFIKLKEYDTMETWDLKIAVAASFWLVDKFVRDDHFLLVEEVSKLIGVEDAPYYDLMIMKTEREIFNTCKCISNYVPRVETPKDSKPLFWT